MKDDFRNLIKLSVPYKQSISKENKSYSFPKYLPSCKNLSTLEKQKIISDDEVYSKLFENIEDIFSKLKIIPCENDFINKLTYDPFEDKENQKNIVDNESNYDDKENMSINYNFESQYLKHIYTENYTTTDPKYLINIRNMNDTRTTCMIKNIPNKYTQTMLINLLNEHHFGCFDFVYLRMDFKNKCNVGYAFVNFTKIEYIISFYHKINNKGWKMFSSNKISELTYASIQGFDNLINKFRNSLVMKEQESYRPKVFYKDGHLKGYEKPMSF